MKKYISTILLFFAFTNAFAQNVGIVRNNYFSNYFDSTFMMEIEVLDSGTIRLGSIDPITGVVSNIGSSEYNSGINLNGATLNPYLDHYYIGSGFNLLTFDMNSGDIINNVPITGPLPSGSFQNYRFNPSDSVVYGMVPHNYYSTYYDSIAMMDIEVLDSAVIRFASINPLTGVYSLIGNTSYNNIYTLAGNSINPYEMVYYYSAVDTLIGIDLYNGEPYSVVPIQLPATAIFENIVYSCSDTTIYGIVRQNFISSYYDPILMIDIEQVDSTTFRFSKIDPNTGVVTFISPYNIGVGGNLTGGSFVDPGSSTYFFSYGNEIVGVSLATGLVTSSILKTYESGFTLDMMRSSSNCLNARIMRFDQSANVSEIANEVNDGIIFPNPAQNEITVQINAEIQSIQIVDLTGSILVGTVESKIDISNLPQGVYFAKVIAETGGLLTQKFVKN